MGRMEKLAEKSWSLEDMKGREFLGIQYAIQVSETDPELLFFFERKEEVLEYIPECQGALFELDRKEVNILTSSPAAVDFLVDKLRIIEESLAFDDLGEPELGPDQNTINELLDKLLTHRSDPEFNLYDDGSFEYYDILEYLVGCPDHRFEEFWHIFDERVKTNIIQLRQLAFPFAIEKRKDLDYEVDSSFFILPLNAECIETDKQLIAARDKRLVMSYRSIYEQLLTRFSPSQTF